MADAALENLAVTVLAGLVAGWLAGIVTRGSGYGLAGNILVAVAGAAAGLYLGDWMGLAAPGALLGNAVSALLGAFGLLYVLARFRRG